MRKVLAGTLAALTAGATLAMGAFAITSLGDYVQKSDGSLTSPIIVVGDGSGSTGAGIVKDVLGAADIAAAVAGYATTTVSGTGTTTSVVNGADVATADNKLYFRSQMNKARNTLTSNDASLSTLLAQGTANVDLTGTFTYNQYINLGARQTTFGNSGGTLPETDDDPALYLDIGSDAATSPLYNLTVTFNKPLNISDPDVQGGTIKIAGVEYTISSTSGLTNNGWNPLVLFGGSNAQTIQEGGTATVNVGGTDYTVGVLGVSTATAGVVTVNGVSKSVTKGVSYTIEGLDVYVKDIYYLSKESQVSSIKLIAGSAKITLKSASKVKTGTADDPTDGTMVTLAGGSAGLSKITIGVAGADNTHDYTLAGASNAFTDPVFGTFKVAFNGMTPALDDASRDQVVVDNSANTGATVKFTDYRGNEKTLTWAQTRTGSNFNPMLNQSSTRKYVVIEGKKVNENDYVLLAPTQESEFGHIFQLTEVDDIGGTNPSFTLTDAISGDIVQVYLEQGGYKQFYLDGQAYCANNVSTTAMNFTWGVGNTCQKSATGGSKIMAFPLIKMKNGAYITFVDNATSLTALKTYELPGNVSAQRGNFSSTVAGKITYKFNGAANASMNRIVLTNTDSLGAAGTVLVDNFPAVLIMQEKDNSSVKDFITVDNTMSDATNLYIKVDEARLTGTYNSQSLSSDTTITQYLNTYGTQVEYDSDNQGINTVKYPDTQAVATVGIGPNPTFAVGGSSLETAMKITKPVAKTASELSSTAPGADLVLIGGPCANALAAKVLEGITSCNTWNYTEGIIMEVTGKFTDGSKALVVAGTSADNTRTLAAKVMAGTLSYSK